MIIRDLIIKEAVLMEDPIYRQFRSIGRYITERKMTDSEILQVFADVEAGMTDKATGANRTWMGRGKDTTMDFAGGVKDAYDSIINSIQTSAPVAAVDVAYDQATDALAKVAGGQNGAVMNAIKKYRMLAKEYPKTAGFAKAALVAIAGLATGGAGLPIIAGLTYALDSAIKGDKLSSVLGKGAGAAALSYAGQAAYGAYGDQAGAGVGDGTAMGDTTPPDTGVPPTDAVPSRFDEIVSNSVDYKVKPGDTLSDILADRKINPEAFRRLPGNEVFFGPDGNPNILKAGQAIKLPDPSDIPDLNRMSYTTPDPANYARFDKEYDTTGYTGQYNPNNSPYSLDATTNLKKQGLGSWGGDSGIAANRVAQDAARLRENWLPAVKLIRLPVNRLIDDRITILSWALNESIGRKSKSINLSTVGVYTVFENIDRYRKAILGERLPSTVAGPGREQLPDYYRPDAPGAPAPVTPAAKKGWVGKGLDWVNQKAKAVGGALGTFGHQFTTNVTKEKLKMNWQLKGKPSDSDQLSAWLLKQGVPQQVITSVYNKMGIPHTAPAASPAPTTPAATTAATAPASTTPAATTAATAPAATAIPTTGTTKPATNTFPGEDPQGPGYVGRREVARRQAARGATTSKPATPNFAQQGGGYAKVNQPTTMKYSGVPMAKPATATAKPSLPAGPTGAYNAALANRGADMDAERNNPAKNQLESLSWSRNFNPGMTLYRQMKREQS
jgi:hypothetical protein